MDSSSFYNKIKNIHAPRTHTIKNSLNSKEYHKYYNSIKPLGSKYNITRTEYGLIIRKINNILRDMISKGEDVKLPFYMGSIELRKYPAKYSIENGKVVTNLPIDWQSTLKLWYDDREAFTKKILIKKETKEIFKILYNKKKARYNNKIFYKFHFNRELKIQLKNNIKEGIIDAFNI